MGRKKQKIKDSSTITTASDVANNFRPNSVLTAPTKFNDIHVLDLPIEILTGEAPKKEKSKDKTQKPKLARDAPKELNLTGTFYAGIATMKVVDKSDLELSRTQRIIIEEKGIHYEYTRNKNPY